MENYDVFVNKNDVNISKKTSYNEMLVLCKTQLNYHNLLF